MKGSVLDRFGLEEYRKIREQVVYDPSAANGLRWRYTKSGRRSTEISKGFWIDKVSYQAPWVVLILNDCWPEEGQNVAKRIDPSGSWSDVTNLAWGVHGESRRQSAEQRRLALIHSVLGDAAPVFDERRRLAAPCRRGHLWNDHPLGLQIKQGQCWRCEQCTKEHDQAPERKKQSKSWYEQNKEDQRLKARERMAALREDPSYRKLMAERTKACRVRRWSTVGRESRLKGVQGLMMPPGRALTGPEAGVVRQLVAEGHPVDWAVLEPLVAATLQLREALKGAGKSPTVAQLVEAEQRRHWQENPEAKREHDRWWDKYKYLWRYRCDPSFRLHECQRNSEKKARNRGNHTVKISKSDMDARYAEFDNRCAFCGSADRITIEHVVARSKGGPHALGNILPACHRCNMSKRDHDPESWYRKQPQFSELRWRKICRVLGWQRSSVGQLALL
jgi:hypothetical protein